MGLIWGIVENQKSAGSTATTIASILNATFPVHNMHIDVYFQVATTEGTGTVLLQAQKLQEVHLNTTSGTPESSIRGQDLWDFHPTALGRSPYYSALTTVATDPMLFTMVYPFSPYPDDPTENFAMPGGRGTTFEMQFTADSTTTSNTYTYDLTLEGTSTTDKPNPKGYIKFVRDEETGVSNQSLFTRFVAKRLLGIFNFQTTNFDAVAAAGAITATSIQTQEITFSRSTVYGPFRPARAGALQYLPQVASSTPPFQLTKGSSFHNFGINNRVGDLGINVSLESNTEIKTTAGSAADAYRVYPVCLVQ